MRISDWSSDVCSSDLDERLHVDKLGTQSIDNLCQVRIVEESAATGMDNGVGDLVIGQAWIGGMQHRADARNREEQIGRASCRERGCQYVEISVVAESFKKR